LRGCSWRLGEYQRTPVPLLLYPLAASSDGQILPRRLGLFSQPFCFFLQGTNSTYLDLIDEALIHLPAFANQ
jgi:hypothetical protein